MKSLIKLLISLFILVLTACNKQLSEESIPVSLCFGGEIQISESPLTKGNSSDLLMDIQVYKDGSYFARGLFDHLDNITVNLLSGHSYTFNFVMIENGKQIIHSYTSYGYTYYDASPFGDLAFWHATILTNELDYSSGSGHDITDIRACSLNANRYECVITDYSPTVDGIIDVELKHLVVGVKYVVSGLSDGTLSLTVQRGAETLISESAISSNSESDGAIFECYDLYSALTDPSSYKETATVSLQWTRSNGITQDLGSVDIDLLRNRMNVIRINLNDSGTDTLFGLNIENTTMGNEDTTMELS